MSIHCNMHCPIFDRKECFDGSRLEQGLETWAECNCLANNRTRLDTAPQFLDDAPTPRQTRGSPRRHQYRPSLYIEVESRLLVCPPYARQTYTHSLSTWYSSILWNKSRSLLHCYMGWWGLLGQLGLLNCRSKSVRWQTPSLEGRQGQGYVRSRSSCFVDITVEGDRRSREMLI